MHPVGGYDLRFLPELQVLRDLTELAVDLGDHVIGRAFPVTPDLNPNLDLQVVAHGGVADVADLVGEVLDLAGIQVRRGDELPGAAWASVSVSAWELESRRTFTLTCFAPAKSHGQGPDSTVRSRSRP